MNPVLGLRGACVAPHALAAQAGRDVLRDGGTAIDAAIAMAATLAVVYPHMTGLGGDGFWLLRAPGQGLRALDASGAAGQGVHAGLYAGQAGIPWRGPGAAITVAGTVSGWAEAHALSRQWGSRLPWARLLEAAIHHAEHGHPVTHSQAETTRAKLAELRGQPGFAATYLIAGELPRYGQPQRQPALAFTLRRIAAAGADDFYRGALAADIAADLQAAGSPLTVDDLAAQRARWRTPLSLRVRGAQLHNLPPPTQGLASLAILGLYDRLRQPGWTLDQAPALHAMVECIKQAFGWRDRHVACPSTLAVDPQALLAGDVLDRMAARVPLRHASPWPAPPGDGDTTWFGAIDEQGRAASVIQSLYFEYGSGVVLPNSGLVWQNRGCAFELAPGRPRSLAPGRQPFHTLNPAMAELDDGRLLVYGTMGGDGQPQTQAALFTRIAWGGEDVRRAVAAPRWLLGRTWAEPSPTLKLESRFEPAVVQALRELGHPVEVGAAFDERMGHAGALLRHPDGLIEGGEDPRSDGAVAAY